MSSIFATLAMSVGVVLLAPMAASETVGAATEAQSEAEVGSEQGTETVPSSPAERGERGEDRWAPALALTSGLTIQMQNAELRSYFASTGDDLRPPDKGSDIAVSPYFGVNLEVTSPTLEFVPGRPRAFVNGDMLPTFAARRAVALEGNPKGFGLPFDPAQRSFNEEDIRGQGSWTTATIDTAVWGAGLGLTFPFELLGRQLHLKPSLGWIRYSVDVEGRVLRAFKPQRNAPADIRFVTLAGQDNKTFDGIGPGLELELEMPEAVDYLRASLFLDLHAYRVLGDRKVHFEDEVRISDALDPQLGPQTYAAAWDFSVVPWMFRTGIGFRIQWLGK